MYLVIVDGKVVAECKSTATAGGVLNHHGRGLIAEVLCKAQENRGVKTHSRNSKVARKC